MKTIYKIHFRFLSVFLCFVFAHLGEVTLAFAQSTSEPVKQRLLLEARLSEGSPIISDGLEWRIFPVSDDVTKEPEVLAYSSGGSKAFNIEPGDYIIHAAFGRAGAVKKISIGSEAIRHEFNLNAGGLKLKATTTGDVRIPNRRLKFNIHEQKLQNDGSRKLVARDVRPSEITTLPSGIYHVVSTFGKLNATVRADLRVEAGKLTEAKLEHRAAILTFRLVRSTGGDAVADTAWSILTENGEVIKESKSTFPTMVLSEGEYTAIAKNNDKFYSQVFEVKSGFNKDVEVIKPD